MDIESTLKAGFPYLYQISRKSLTTAELNESENVNASLAPELHSVTQYYSDLYKKKVSHIATFDHSLLVELESAAKIMVETGIKELNEYLSRMSVMDTGYPIIKECIDSWNAAKQFYMKHIFSL